MAMGHITGKCGINRTLAWFAIAMSILTSGCLSGCGHKLHPETMSASALLAAGEQAMADEKYHRAGEFFQAIQTRFPFDPLARQALRDSMYVHFKNDEPALVLSATETYIRLYPRDAHVDYAYYMKGMSAFVKDLNWFQSLFRVDLAERDVTHFKTAFRDFNTLVRLYPHSCYAEDARMRMMFVRNVLAEHILQIAHFYYDRQAYVAAVNRANMVVLHYQGAPQVEDALALLVKSYDALGMKKQASQSQHLLDQLRHDMSVHDAGFVSKPCEK